MKITNIHEIKTKSYINNLEKEIFQGIQSLASEKQKEVLEFVKSLQSNSLIQKWEHISNEEAQALQNEFAQEDISFCENILSDYLYNLQQQEED